MADVPPAGDASENISHSEVKNEDTGGDCDDGAVKVEQQRTASAADATEKGEGKEDSDMADASAQDSEVKDSLPSISTQSHDDSKPAIVEEDQHPPASTEDYPTQKGEDAVDEDVKPEEQKVEDDDTRGEDEGRGDEDEGTRTVPSTPGRGILSAVVGRRIRYKFVCTPPPGYVPSEVDAKTLPREFFAATTGMFTLKPPPKAADTATAEMREQPAAEALDSSEKGGMLPAACGGEVRPRSSMGGRKGPIGSHVSDFLVLSPLVAKELEARGEVLPIPFNCQPPKKRFRTNFGYVTEPQQLYQVRGLEARPPSPNPLLFR